MGGVEDDEPSSKRMKVYSGESVGLSKCISLREKGNCSLTYSMAQDDDEVIGSKGAIKKVELVRVITEALYSLGYSKTGAHLEKESGIPLHSTVVNSFMKQIMDGKWDESVASLHEIGLTDEIMIKKASFVILEQKFFELLDGEKFMDALKTLRTEIAPLCVNDDRVRDLSSFLVSPLQNLVDAHSGQESRCKSPLEVLEKLRKLLPSAVMIPEKILVHLFEQALDLQRDTCRFHNSLVRDVSVLTDHQCGMDQIPSQTLQVLHEHRDEVWFLQFSHNGKYLASASRDLSVIIWEMVNIDGGPVSITRKHTLEGHEKPISYVSWSPDDSQILSCGVEEAVRRWDISSGQCLSVYEETGLGLVSCGWAVDGKSIFTGSTDKRVAMWDLQGKQVRWRSEKTVRNADMGITSMKAKGNITVVITVCKDNVIIIFDWETRLEKFIQEDHLIVSFALSEDGKFLLVSLSNEELHLWSIDGFANLVAKYKGHKRSRYVVRSCFGGIEESFIASGSEDSLVYIWNRVSEELVTKLDGHNGAVNCVSWNPINPYILASASDDRTIRIWGSNLVVWKVHNNGNEDNTEAGTDFIEADV